MSKWTNNEDGPLCYCGYDTVVKESKGDFILLCLFHSPEAGAAFELPAEKPDGWPTVQHLIDMGMRAPNHQDPPEGYLCICDDCVNTRHAAEESEE